MKKYRAEFKPYLDDLGKKGLAPGGGSAGALSFCLGCSLIIKAIEHSKNKDQGKVYKNKLNNRLRKISDFKKKVYPYIDKDGELFIKMIKAKGAQKKKYEKKVSNLLKDLADSSQKVFLLAKALDFDIKKSIKSDFYLGLKFIIISTESAIFNLAANSKMTGKENQYLKNVKDKLKKIKGK